MVDGMRGGRERIKDAGNRVGNGLLRGAQTRGEKDARKKDQYAGNSADDDSPVGLRSWHAAQAFHRGARTLAKTRSAGANHRECTRKSTKVTLHLALSHGGRGHSNVQMHFARRKDTFILRPSRGWVIVSGLSRLRKKSKSSSSGAKAHW